MIDLNKESPFFHHVSLIDGELDNPSRDLGADGSVGSCHAGVVGGDRIHGRDPPPDAIHACDDEAYADKGRKEEGSFSHQFCSCVLARFKPPILFLLYHFWRYC